MKDNELFTSQNISAHIFALETFAKNMNCDVTLYGMS